MPETDWRVRLRAVDWPRFLTVYEAATGVPEQIERLHSPDETIALSGIADLRTGLCRQHVQIASAALPALPFIMEVLPASSQRVTAEILELLVGLAITTNPVRMHRFASAVGKRPISPPGWVGELRTALRMALPRIAVYATHQDSTISKSAQMFVEEIGKEISPA